MNKINFDYKKGDKDTVIVFLHGWGIDGSSFNKIVGSLSSDMSILKIDLPGFGLSDEPKEYFDTHEYAYQIFLLLKKLSICNIVLVGHSFGGRLAILLSSIFDINVRALFLTSSAGLNRFNLIRWIKIKKYKILKKLVKCNILNDAVLLKFGSSDYQNANIILKIVLKKVVNQDLSIFIKMIKIKDVYLVWDKGDKETGFWICKKLHRHIKYSKIIIYNSGGHFAAFKNFRKFSRLLTDVYNKVS